AISAEVRAGAATLLAIGAHSAAGAAEIVARSLLGPMIGVVGASLGPLPLGLAQDYLGGYNAMLIGLAAIPLLWALVAVLFLRQPVKPEPVKDAIR
ncbi:MAG: hypothetical protein VW835_22415, partial [Rickettsiales bacterium]